MKISDPYLKIAIGSNLTPEDSNLSGSTHVGLELQKRADSTKSVLAARLVFSAAAQTAIFSPNDGNITVTGGTAQVENATVVAAAGTTVAGNLALTLTGIKIVGSPLAVSVPLTPAAHGTADLIAAAIAAKLQTLPAVTNFYTVVASGATVRLTSIFGFANDATLNLAIPAGLGITAAANSGNTTAGVAGVLISRPGGAQKDIFGGPWDTCTMITQLAVRGIGPGTSYVSSEDLAKVSAGMTSAKDFGANGALGQLFTAFGPAIIDVIAHCE